MASGQTKTSPLSEIEWIEKKIEYHQRELENYQQMLRRVRGRLPMQAIPTNMETFFVEPQ